MDASLCCIGSIFVFASIFIRCIEGCMTQGMACSSRSTNPLHDCCTYMHLWCDESQFQYTYEGLNWGTCVLKHPGRLVHTHDHHDHDYNALLRAYQDYGHQGFFRALLNPVPYYDQHLYYQHYPHDPPPQPPVDEPPPAPPTEEAPAADPPPADPPAEEPAPPPPAEEPAPPPPVEEAAPAAEEPAKPAEEPAPEPAPAKDEKKKKKKKIKNCLLAWCQ